MRLQGNGAREKKPDTMEKCEEKVIDQHKHGSPSGILALSPMQTKQ
jgi:hypothetical protein